MYDDMFRRLSRVVFFRVELVSMTTCCTFCQYDWHVVHAPSYPPVGEGIVLVQDFVVV